MMSTRQEFHDYIDSIPDEHLVKKYLELIKSLDRKMSGKLWQELNAAEQEEVLKAYTDSFDEGQLVANEEVKSYFRKWLGK